MLNMGFFLSEILLLSVKGKIYCTTYKLSALIKSQKRSRKLKVLAQEYCTDKEYLQGNSH